MKLISAVVIAVVSIMSGRDVNLIGRWETKPSANGNVTGVIFRDEKNFEGYVNNKPFFTGNYTVSNDTMSFTDNACEGKIGVYKVVLFSSSDSLRFEFISDDCERRREGMKRIVLGKLKANEVSQ